MDSEAKSVDIIAEYATAINNIASIIQETISSPRREDNLDISDSSTATKDHASDTQMLASLPKSEDNIDISDGSTATRDAASSTTKVASSSSVEDNLNNSDSSIVPEDLIHYYQKRSTYPSLEIIAYVYENTREGSGAKKVMAETVHSVVKRPIQDPKHELNLKDLSALMAGNGDFPYDVMVLCAGVKERDWCYGKVGNSHDLRRCLFYVHRRGEEKRCLYR